jgi:hypothetical protein
MVLFLLIMLAVVQLLCTQGAPAQDLVGSRIDWIQSASLEPILAALNAPRFLRDFLIDSADQPHGRTTISRACSSRSMNSTKPQARWRLRPGLPRGSHLDLNAGTHPQGAQALQQNGMGQEAIDPHFPAPFDPAPWHGNSPFTLQPTPVQRFTDPALCAIGSQPPGGNEASRHNAARSARRCQSTGLKQARVQEGTMLHGPAQNRKEVFTRPPS